MTYPHVCMITHSKMMVLNIATGAMTDIKTFGVSQPFLLARDSSTFFSYSTLSAMVVDSYLNADHCPTTFAEAFINHTRCG